MTTKEEFAGIIYDFLGFLTGLKEPIVLGATENSSCAATEVGVYLQRYDADNVGPKFPEPPQHIESLPRGQQLKLKKVESIEMFISYLREATEKGQHLRMVECGNLVNLQIAELINSALLGLDSSET